MATFLESRDPDIKQRRQEIEGLLAEHGLEHRRRMFFKEEVSAPESKDRLKKFRFALESLGPVFSLFGRYLGTRADLLSIPECLELMLIPDRSDPMDSKMVHAVLEKEWGRKPETVFLSFDESPRSSRLVYQMHYGRFVDGTPVRIQIINPSFQSLVERDSQVLHLLNPAFVAIGWNDFPTEAVIADFMRFIPLYVDRQADMDAMTTLAEEARQSEYFAAPQYLPDLSTSLVRTVERMQGWSLDEMMAGSSEEGEASFKHELPKNLDLGLTDVARRTCFVWLRMALFGSHYPVEIDSGDISILPTHKVVFHDGIFTSLPSVAQDHIWQYLQATAAHDPDSAFDYLMQEMEDRDSALNESELRTRFRQVVPFRDGAWSHSDSGNSLAENLFVHWRLIRECGLQPRIHLLDFFKGLFTLVSITKRLVPEQDALREGLDELRLRMGFGKMREMMDLNVWQDTFGKYATSMFELPKRLDEIMERTSEGGFRPGQNSSGNRRSASQRSTSAKVVGMVCMMGAIILVYNHLAGGSGGDEWGERIAAVLLLILGVSVLRVIRKT